MTDTRIPYTTKTDQAAAEQAAIAAELRAIRLAEIEDVCRAAEGRGEQYPNVHIMDIYWLLRIARGDE